MLSSRADLKAAPPPPPSPLALKNDVMPVWVSGSFFSPKLDFRFGGCLASSSASGSGVQFNRHLKFKAWVKAWVKDEVKDAFREAFSG